MSTSRSDELYFVWAESASKFDYFMAGLSGALAGYIGQNLNEARFGINGVTMELVALACFAFAFLAAIRRIEHMIVLQRLNSTQLNHLEKAGASMEASKSGKLNLNTETGQILSHAQLAQQVSLHTQAAHELESTLKQVHQRTLRWYSTRDWLLIAGMVALVVARVLPAVGRP